VPGTPRIAARAASSSSARASHTCCFNTHSRAGASAAATATSGTSLSGARCLTPHCSVSTAPLSPRPNSAPLRIHQPPTRLGRAGGSTGVKRAGAGADADTGAGAEAAVSPRLCGKPSTSLMDPHEAGIQLARIALPPGHWNCTSAGCEAIPSRPVAASLAPEAQGLSRHRVTHCGGRTVHASDASSHCSPKTPSLLPVARPSEGFAIRQAMAFTTPSPSVTKAVTAELLRWWAIISISREKSLWWAIRGAENPFPAAPEALGPKLNHCVGLGSDGAVTTSIR
jgi:hypothetical protein